MKLRSILPAAAAMLLAAPAAAQSAAPAAPPASGCRGTSSQTSSFTIGGVEFPGYPEIQSVQAGSPAEHAGLRRGDVVIMQDGRDVVGEAPAERVPGPGEPVRLVVRRDGAMVPITVVLGEWHVPPGASPNDRVCRPVG